MDEKIKKYSDETKLLKKLTEDSIKSSLIEPDLYTLYDVKKGLRDINGVGVLAGLTKIGDTVGHDYINGERVSIRGRLSYRGYEIEDIVERFTKGDRFGFEEAIYLLLFGERPDEKELTEFNELLAGYRILPDTFVKENIMTAPSKDMINMLARSVLVLYSLDEEADDVSIENVVRQSLQLIACFPMLAVYGYKSFMHYHCRESLAIHKPLPGLSTAENLLHMLRPDSKYTRFEAKLLDLALVLHAEHGGGDNSSFITHVATSSATDTYSVIAAALGALKGPQHGGANNKVVMMFDDLKKNVKDWENEEEIADYLRAILRKEAFDKSGLIYGLGHAVYSLSDPRAEILKNSAEILAKEKGCEEEFMLYKKVEEIGPRVIGEASKIYKGVSANVDFYSGLVYKMLDIPMELYTSIFAVSRIVGWSAHRIEELVNQGKIIRPAYKSVAPQRIVEKRLI